MNINAYVTLLPSDAILGSKCTQNAFAALWGSLQRSPRPLSCVCREGEGREREGEGGKGEVREGGEGREGKWTLATLRTDRRPC